MRTLSFIPALAFCLATLVASGCRSEPSSAGPEIPDTSEPVIVHLQTRHAIVTVIAGPEGPLYTVRTHAGQVHAEHLSARELQQRAPGIHRLMKRSYAEEESNVIWAGMLEHDRSE